MHDKYRLLRHNIRNNLYNGIAWSIGYNFVMPFVGVLAAQMGAVNSHYALLSSVPALMTIIATLPASMIIEKFRQQRKILTGLLLFSRLCYLFMALLPLIHFNQIHSLIFLVGVYTAVSSIIGVAWQSMMGELIPANYRNRVFAQRNFWSSLSGMIVALFAGWAIDSVPYPYGYQIAFSLGFIASLFETWYFWRLRKPEDTTASSVAANESSSAPAKPAGRFSLKQNALSILSQYRMENSRPFYLFCVSAVVYIFSWQAAWPIYLKVKVDVLHASNMMMSWDAVAGSIGSLLGFGPWARFSDRKGNGLTVFLSALLLALTPLLWIHAPSMAWVIAYDFIGGFVTAGFTQSTFNRLLEIVASESRQQAIAIYTTLSQVSAIFAPIAGMKIYESLSYPVTMSLMSGLRIFGAFCFLVIVSRRFVSPFDNRLNYP